MSERSLAIRPQVGDLSFQVFDWPLHPDLIESLHHRRFERDGYVLDLDITPAGHWLRWKRGDVVLVEVLSAHDSLLPETRQLFVHRVGGERAETRHLGTGVTYHVCFQRESLSERIFQHLSDELRAGAEREGVLHLLTPQDRLGFSPLTYVDLQARKNSLLVHAYHTFPDDLAIVRTQTLIEIEPAAP